MNELVGSVGGVVSDLDLKVKLVVLMPVGALDQRDTSGRNTAQIGFDLDKFLDGGCSDI